METGCYIDGGIRNERERLEAVIQVAEGFGMAPPTYSWNWIATNELTIDQFAELEAFAEEAENWLNENVQVEGASWYWHEGDFGLWEDEPE